MVLSPHGNARYFLGGNRPLWYILLRYSATTVMYGIFSIFYFLFFWMTPACVWCCDASTFTEHENHQTSNLNKRYFGEHNKRQFPDHSRQIFAANIVVCVRVFPVYSERQIRWTYQPGSHRRKVAQDFSSTFLLRCVPLFFSREGFRRSFPSSTVKSN